MKNSIAEQDEAFTISYIYVLYRKFAELRIGEKDEVSQHADT